MPDLQPIPPALRIEDTCDYCRRPFVRALGAPAICLSCGLENVRGDVRAPKPTPESAMLAPAVERAVLSPAKPRRPRKRKS